MSGVAIPLQFAAAAKTLTGTYTLRITATGSNMTKTKDIQVMVLPPMGLSTQILPSGVKGQAYSLGITVTGGISPYTFTKTAGSMPDGIIQNADGTFSGTPTARGTFAFTIQISDSVGHSMSKDYSIRVYDPAWRGFTVESDSWTVAKSMAGTINASDTITVRAADDYGNPVELPVQIQLNSSSSACRFSTDYMNFSQGITTVKPSVPAGSTTFDFVYADGTAGLQTLTVFRHYGTAECLLAGGVACHAGNISGPEVCKPCRISDSQLHLRPGSYCFRNA